MFILTSYCCSENDEKYLLEAVHGILNQTDQEFQLILVDDCSPFPSIRKLLDDIVNLDKRITVHVKDKRTGVALSRNYGVVWASQFDAPFVLFNDGDDISAISRLEKTRELFNDERVDLVYSSYIPIDENSNIRDLSDIVKDVRDIIEGHSNSPPNGSTAWFDLTMKFGYSNLTSTTSVRTSLAIEVPFKPYKFSEDTHAWYRMMALGNQVAFDPSFPTYYRMPTDSYHGIASKDRVGDSVYVEKVRADVEGFLSSLPLAEQTGKIPEHKRGVLLFSFCLRLAEELSNISPTILKDIINLASEVRLDTVDG